MRNSPALTLVEILVVVVIIGIIAIPLYTNLFGAKSNQSLLTSANKLDDLLTTAHVYAKQAREKKSWSVRSIGANSFQLVSGDLTDPLSWKTEKVKQLEGDVYFETGFNIWFDKGSGTVNPNTPNFATPIIVTLRSSNNRKQTVTISPVGVINTK